MARSAWENEALRQSTGGQSRYNAIRWLRAGYRRLKVARLWLKYSLKYSPLTRGLQTRLADKLGVSRSTASRDLAYLFRLASGSGASRAIS